jgi:hypothetical protein
MKYRVDTYFTTQGFIKIIALPDSIYGEWIVYEKGEPKYHINVHRADSHTDRIIKVLLDSQRFNIDWIIEKISQDNNRNLKVNLKRPIGVKVKSELTELDLGPLSDDLFYDFEAKFKPPWIIHPGVDPHDMFWRMGKGEDSLSFFAVYYNGLNENQKKEYIDKYPAPKDWADFYE